MRERIARSLVFGAFVLTATSLPFSAHAVRVIIEAESGTRPEYKETEGVWVDTPKVSSAPWMPEDNKVSRALPAVGGRLAGKIEFRPIFDEAGTYYIDITWPEGANAAGVTVNLKGAEGTLAKKITLTPKEGANAWFRLGTVTIKEPKVQPTIELDFNSSPAPVDPSQPWQAIIDGLRHDTRDIKAADELASAGQNNPFAPPTAGAAVDNPFGSKTPAPSGSDNPFAPKEPGSTAPLDNPFGKPAEVAAADPNNPFGKKPSEPPPGVDNPFAQPAAQPAATPGEPPPADPFGKPAPTTVASNDNPFDPSGTKTPASGAPPPADPFGKPEPTTVASNDNPFDPSGTKAPAPGESTPPDPFANASDDPFGAEPAVPTPAAGSPDPFAAVAPSTTTGKVNDDPFATDLNADPFGGTTPAATPAPPRGDDNPFAGMAAVSPVASPAAPVDDPFASSSTGNAAGNPFEGTDAVVGESAPIKPKVDPRSLIAPMPDDVEFVDPDATIPGQPAPPVKVDTSFTKKGNENAIKLPYLATIDVGKEAAKKTGKPLLVLFSGDSLSAVTFEDIMTSPAVAKKLEEFVLVRVDYRKNREVARDFAVRSYPYIVIIDENGHTKGHIAPMENQERLIAKLTPFSQKLFR